MLQILWEYNLYLNIDKCQFEKKEVDYLGVHIREQKIQMEEDKVAQVQEWKLPYNVQEVCWFLRFTRYYCYFIKGYSEIMRPLLQLTKKTEEWQWGDEQQQAFKDLWDQMCSKPILGHLDVN